MNAPYSQVSNKQKTHMELPADTDILISRSFAAPVDVVYEALTRPEHVRHWWAPQSRGQMVTCEMDVRIGGKWRYTMRTNDGFEVGFSGEYREINAPNRIVSTEIFDPFPDVVSVVTVTLEEKNGVTLFRSLVRYPSKAVRDQVLATGMESGMRESYEQLDAVVLAISPK